MEISKKKTVSNFDQTIPWYVFKCDHPQLFGLCGPNILEYSNWPPTLKAIIVALLYYCTMLEMKPKKIT